MSLWAYCSLVVPGVRVALGVFLGFLDSGVLVGRDVYFFQCSLLRLDISLGVYFTVSEHHASSFALQVRECKYIVSTGSGSSSSLSRNDILNDVPAGCTGVARLPATRRRFITLCEASLASSSNLRNPGQPLGMSYGDHGMSSPTPAESQN